MARSRQQVQRFEIGQFVRQAGQGLATVIGFHDNGALDVVRFVDGLRSMMHPARAYPSSVCALDEELRAEFRATIARINAADAEERADV